MPVTGTLAEQLDARLSAFWGVMGRQAHGELSRTAAAVLATLRDQGPQRITTLADQETVAQPSMTTLVTRMARDGLVERESDPADARAVLVCITSRGRERLEARRRARTARLEERLRALDDDERAALAAALPVLDKLIERSTS